VDKTHGHKYWENFKINHRWAQAPAYAQAILILYRSLDSTHGHDGVDTMGYAALTTRYASIMIMTIIMTPSYSINLLLLN